MKNALSILKTTACALVLVGSFGLAQAQTATPAASETVANEEMVSAELQDGTKIVINGDEVFVVGADETLTPAPDGEHTLSDGTVVKTQGGVIVQ